MPFVTLDLYTDAAATSFADPLVTRFTLAAAFFNSVRALAACSPSRISRLSISVFSICSISLISTLRLGNSFRNSRRIVPVTSLSVRMAPITNRLILWVRSWKTSIAALLIPSFQRRNNFSWSSAFRAFSWSKSKAQT